MTMEEGIAAAKLFEQAGCDSMHLRLGPLGHHVAQFGADLYFILNGIEGCTGFGTQYDFGKNWQGMLIGNTSGCGIGLNVAAEYKKALSIPCGVVTYNDPAHAPDFFEQALEDGKADFFLMTRPLTVDMKYVNKLKEGRIDEIAPCTRCLHCHIGSNEANAQMAYCRVNALTQRVMREGGPATYELEPAATPKKVMVIGGGPAGMEAARIAAARGHNVTLYEKRGALGFMLDFAASVKGPHENLADLKNYLIRQLELNGVEVKTGTEVTQELIHSEAPDAVILADVGVLALAKRHAPHMSIHISTQASVVNFQSARAWHDLGADRVILARELSLEEIAQIRAKTPPELELEAFAHGAMCVSYSGRCLLSNYMTGRDSNRGACAQPCRYQYALMEEKRPGEYFPVYEENGETYIMNSRDMCMIDHVPELLEAGLDSLKLEGRAKSAYYAAIVTGAYRHAIDAAAAGQPLDSVWRDEVEHISHRHYSTGFFYGQPGQYTDSSRYIRDWQIVAKVLSCDEEGNARLTLNNKFAVGDQLELVGPDVRPQALTVEGLWDEEGTPLTEVRKPQMVFSMKLPCPVPPLSLLRRQADLTP